MVTECNEQYRSVFLKLFENVGQEEQYSRNEIIHLDGIKGDFVWLVKKGKAKHVFHDMEGYEKTILILSRGDIFGEITLFQNDFNLVMTQAIEETVVNRIDREDFLKIITGNPEIYELLLKSMTRKFRIILYQMRDLSFRSIEGRLANLLLRLAQQQGVDTPQRQVMEREKTRGKSKIQNKKSMGG